MYWITGDTHFPLDWNKIYTWYKHNPNFSKGDTIIICGDAGFLWNNSSQEKKALQKLSQLPFTILFVDGNHENFNLLNKVEQVTKYGNIVGKLSNNIFHLLRGNIYTIDNKTVWTMGGAVSTDKYCRVINKTWWEEEVPSYQEQEEGVYALDSAGCSVDTIITHAGPQSVIKELAYWFEGDEVTRYLEFIKNNTKYNKWYFGHYHLDKNIDDKHYCLYNSIIPFE